MQLQYALPPYTRHTCTSSYQTDFSSAPFRHWRCTLQLPSIKQNKLSVLSQQIASDKGIEVRSNPMANSRVLSLLFLLHLIAAVSAAAAELHQLWAYKCVDDFGNDTSNSTFKSNLNKILTALSTTNHIPYGFLNLTIGEEPDKAGVIALCRGDIDAAACHTCVDSATSSLTALCPNEFYAFGSAENCSVSFSSGDILRGSWSMYPSLSSVSGSYAADVDHFIAGLQTLLESLPDRTVSGDSRLKFATGEANVTADHRAYALTQCTPDLSSFDCLGCLYRAIYSLLKWEGVRGRTGARVVFPSCSARYELHKFYSSPDPLPIPARSSNGKGRAESKTVIIAVVSVIACLSLLTNFIVCCWRRRETKPMADMELDEELHTYTEHNKQAYNVFGGSYAKQ